MSRRSPAHGVARQRAISRDDIEASFRQLAGGIGEQMEEVRPSLVRGAAVVGVVVLVGVYLLGRRAGTRRSALVEIRRL